MPSFGARLGAAFAVGRRLCVGIDPHATTLAAWGLEDTAQGAEHMGRAVVAAAAGHSACIKPQVAFFERFGAPGYVALERILADAREAGLMVIADVKRGDIGSTFAAYAEAWLKPGSPLEADAMTVHAYQGVGALAGADPYLRTHGKGLFVLAATSNPEAREVQRAVVADDVTLAAHIVAEARRLNALHGGDTGSVGVVLGATIDLDEFAIDSSTPSAGAVLPVLAPGFGHQGAQVSQVKDLFGALSDGVLVSESRSIINGGKTELAARIARSNESIREAYA